MTQSEHHSPTFHPTEVSAIPHWTSREPYAATRLDMYGRGRAPLFTQAERRERLKRMLVWIGVLLFCVAVWTAFGCTVLHVLGTLAKGGR